MAPLASRHDAAPSTIPAAPPQTAPTWAYSGVRHRPEKARGTAHPHRRHRHDTTWRHAMPPSRHAMPLRRQLAPLDATEMDPVAPEGHHRGIAGAPQSPDGGAGARADAHARVSARAPARTRGAGAARRQGEGRGPAGADRQSGPRRVAAGRLGGRAAPASRPACPAAGSADGPDAGRPAGRPPPRPPGASGAGGSPRQGRQPARRASISAISASTRFLISSRIGRTASTPLPAGSSSSQSR